MSVESCIQDDDTQRKQGENQYGSQFFGSFRLGRTPSQPLSAPRGAGGSGLRRPPRRTSSPLLLRGVRGGPLVSAVQVPGGVLRPLLRIPGGLLRLAHQRLQILFQILRGAFAAPQLPVLSGRIAAVARSLPSAQIES